MMKKKELPPACLPLHVVQIITDRIQVMIGLGSRCSLTCLSPSYGRNLRPYSFNSTPINTEQIQKLYLLHQFASISPLQALACYNE